MSSHGFAAACLLSLGLIAGCGGDVDDPKVEVSGTATAGGQPVKGGYQLIFMPQEGPAGGATINDDGTFSGVATPGTNTVVVVPLAGSGAAHGGSGAHGQASGGPISKKYLSEDSPLTVTIGESGESDLKVEVGD